MWTRTAAAILKHRQRGNGRVLSLGAAAARWHASGGAAAARALPLILPLCHRRCRLRHLLRRVGLVLLQLLGRTAPFGRHCGLPKFAPCHRLITAYTLGGGSQLYH